MFKIVYDKSKVPEKFLENPLGMFDRTMKAEINLMLNDFGRIGGMQIAVLKPGALLDNVLEVRCEGFAPAFGKPATLAEGIFAVCDNRPSKFISGRKPIIDRKNNIRKQEVVIGSCPPEEDEKIMLFVLPVRNSDHQIFGEADRVFEINDQGAGLFLSGLCLNDDKSRIAFG